jgi:hypothetical protein
MNVLATRISAASKSAPLARAVTSGFYTIASFDQPRHRYGPRPLA